MLLSMSYKHSVSDVSYSTVEYELGYEIEHDRHILDTHWNGLGHDHAKGH